MGRALIRVGDTTTHGGTVITGDETMIVEGQPVARTGDLVVCPRCRGKFPIVSGADNLSAMGPRIAVEGDRTACGATLLLGQMVTTWSPSTEAHQAQFSPPLMEPETPAVPIAAQAPRICLECLQDAALKAETFVVRG